MPLPKVDLIGELFEILGVSKPAAKTVAPKVAAAKPVAKPPAPPSGYTVTPAGQPPGNPMTPVSGYMVKPTAPSAPAPPVAKPVAPTTIITKEDIEAAKWLKETVGHNVKPGRAAVDAAKSMGWTGLSEALAAKPSLSIVDEIEAHLAGTKYGKPASPVQSAEEGAKAFLKDHIGYVPAGEPLAWAKKYGLTSPETYKAGMAQPHPTLFKGATKEPQLNPPAPPSMAGKYGAGLKAEPLTQQAQLANIDTYQNDAAKWYAQIYSAGAKDSAGAIKALHADKQAASMSASLKAKIEDILKKGLAKQVHPEATPPGQSQMTPVQGKTWTQAFENQKGVEAQRQKNRIKGGYTTPAYHGTYDPKRGPEELSRYTEGRSPTGKKSFLAAQPELSQLYAGRGGKVHKYYLNTEDYHMFNAKGKSWGDIGNKAIDEASKAGKKGIIVHNVADEPNLGKDELGPQTTYVVFDRSTARSETAQFDPKKWNLEDLLASGAAVAVTGGLAAGDKAEAAPLPKRLTLYHASPSDFTAFDKSKAGAGVGRAEFAPGIYTAENPKVMEAYAAQFEADRGKAVRYELGADIDKDWLVDFDKPFDQQTMQVQQALTKAGITDLDQRRARALAQVTRDEHDPEAVFLNHDEADRLHKLGVQGVQYLDAGSRTTGQGTRNNVIFDPQTLDIVKKYGLAAVMGGGAAVAGGGGKTEAAEGYEVTPGGAVSSGYEVRPAANQRREEGYTVEPASRETHTGLARVLDIPGDIAGVFKQGVETLKGVPATIAAEHAEAREKFASRSPSERGLASAQTKAFMDIVSGVFDTAGAGVKGIARSAVSRPIAEALGTEPEKVEAVTDFALPGLGLINYGKTAKAIRNSDTIKGFEKLFSPSTVDKNAKDAEALSRGATGGAARDSATTAAAMEPFHRTINALPDVDRLRFIDHVEGGGVGITGLPPELQALGQSMRDAFELRAAKLTSLPSTATTHFIDDYFPHFWQDPKQAATFAQNFGAKGAGKQGSGASLKARSIPTIADGIKAGLVPLTTDPIEATMRYVSSMDRFIASTQVLDTAKLTGHVKYIKPRVYGASGHPDSFKVPDGWVKLNGRGAVNGAGAQAYAPEGFARVYNNFVDRGVHDGAWGNVYDATLKASNAVTALELGVSAFHAVTMANEAMASRAATGIHDIVGGAGAKDAMRVLRGTGKYVTAPLAPVTSYLKGRTLERVYLGQNPGSPDMARITDLLEKAGGRGVSARHAKDYQFSAAGSYFKAWRQGALKMQMATAAADIKAHPIVGTARQAASQIGRIMSTMSSPLFETYIPRLKNGAFYDAMHSALEANPAATYDQQVKMARDIWDSIDNRFGELVDDNIFWNQTMKQVAKLGMRSYSWNLGTVREIGGGVKDIASGQWTPRAAYVVALPMQVALVNAVYQKVMTGKNPESVQDLIGGQTGGEASLRIPSTRPFGRSATSTVPERVSVPGYQKDVLGWYENWQQEAFNKVAKLPRMVLELLLRNKDWQDNPIISGDDKAPPYLQQVFKYVVDSMTPIALQGPLKGHKEGSAITTPQQLAGLRPAHPAVQDPEGYARQQRNIAANAYKRKQALDKRRDRAYQGVD